MCLNCKNCKCMKKPSVVMTVECSKIYYVHDKELVKQMDALIEQFNSTDIQALDGGEPVVIPKPKPKP